MNRKNYISNIILILICFQGCDSGDGDGTGGTLECSLEEIPFVEINASEYNQWKYFSFQFGDVVTIDNPESSLDWDIAFKKNHIRTNGGLSGMGEGCGMVDQTQNWTCELFESTHEVPDDLVCEADIMIEGSGLLPLWGPYEGCYCPGSQCSDCLDDSDTNTVCGEGYAAHYWLDCVKNPALDMWGWFDDDRDFNITEYVMFVRDAHGNDVKIWLQQYIYDDVEPLLPDDDGNLPSHSGYIEMRYQMINF